MTVMFILTSAGFGMMTPRQAQAQGIVDFVVRGGQVLDGCEGITGSRYQAIASQLGIDLEGGVRAGLSDLGSRLQDPASDLGGSILDGLSSIGGQLSDSAIGDAIGSLGSTLGDAFGSAGSGIGNAIGSVAGILGGPVGGILGSVVGGLFGGGGPDKVVEEGLRKIIQQGQRITQFNQSKIIEKERCLDSLAREAGQAALRDFTNASVDWLNTGFERGGETGNQAFVQDLSLFVAEVSDNELREFTEEAENEGGGFANTCGSFGQSVFSTVINNYFQGTPESGVDPGTVRSTIVADGNCLASDAFLRGDFSEGGWSALAQSVSNSGSNPIGAYLEQSNSLDERIREREENEREELQWGQGFLANESGGFTPASVVNGISNRLFESDFNRLELIDEMNEVAGSFASSLIGKVTGLSDGGGNDPESGTGLSTLDGSNTVGGDQASPFGYLAESLLNRVEEQVAIEEDVQLAMEDVLPLYLDDRIDPLISDVRSCLETADFTSQNITEVLSSVINNKERFENNVLRTRVRIDWRGEDLFWQGVIREQSRKMIGWNGTDYNWRDDGVESYARQGFSNLCETDGDYGNAQYVIRQEIIPDPERTFSGAFFSLEQDDAIRWEEGNYESGLDSEGGVLYFGSQWIGSGTYESLVGKNNHRTPIFNADDGGSFFDWQDLVTGQTPAAVNHSKPPRVHTVWEKQICRDSEWHAQITNMDLDFPDTPAGQRDAQNAQCDLIGELEFCIYPAYRSPRLIAGEMYQRNVDGGVEASQCQSRSDAGTHYFVRSGDGVWSTRQCNTRQSPQGSAVEWESGFPDSTVQTDRPAYETRDTDTPLEDQRDLLVRLKEIQAELEEMVGNDDTSDFQKVQADFYALEDQFNNGNTADNLLNNARTFVENVRLLNEALLETDECEGGSDDLRQFGTGFLNDNPESGNDGGGAPGPLSIESFEANRLYESSTYVRVSWESNAESCTASANPSNAVWQGEIGPDGETALNIFGGSILSLTCEREGETDVSSSVEVFPLQERGRLDPLDPQLQ
ncbi:MAG: hypothetical protein WD335_00290 [Candidatus Paceibacterota bacterium]